MAAAIGNQERVELVVLLRECAKRKDLQRGTEVHADILRRDFLNKDPNVATSLVNMYAKSGALATAAQVIDEVPVRDIFIWGALITGYAKHGQGKKALEYFEQMQQEGLCPNIVIFSSLLKACGRMAASDKGKQVHREIVRHGLVGKSVLLDATLVDMYIKCGELAKAAEVLNELPMRDVVSWSTLIAGYAQRGQANEALRLFARMQEDNITPNAVTFTCVLKACGSLGAIDVGERIHVKVIRQGLLEKDAVLGNALVDMYAKCGVLDKAILVLGELPVRDLVSWSSLITGYADWGEGEQALKCFKHMQHEGLAPNAVSFLCVLRACGIIGAVDKGKEIHDMIVRQGLLEENIMLGTALVDMYAKCGALSKAAQVLKELSVQDTVTWNALIAGYAQQGQGQETLKCFEQMQSDGFVPNAATFTCALKACSILRAIEKCELIHNEIVRQGMLVIDSMLGNTLMETYMVCGALTRAAQVHEELSVRTTVSWNILISGYAEHEQGEEALKCFRCMQCEGLVPDIATFFCTLKACGSLGAFEDGEQVYECIIREGILGKVFMLGASVVDMYAKCGALTKAAQVLDELPVRDVVAWSALIAGHIQQGQGEEALKCFDRMQGEGFCPNVVTFSCILKACGSIGAVEKGEQIHNEIVRQGLLEGDVVLGTTLVDMYAKCGALEKAAWVLEELPVRDVACWNVLISGYIEQGQNEDALQCFERMQLEGLSPSPITLSCLLNAFSRAGLLDEGETYFSKMSTKYGITPELEHHTCMVDLFGRAGDFDKALAVIKKMPMSGYSPVWHALLGACRGSGNVCLGKLAFKTAVDINGSDSASYSLISELYVAAGMILNKDQGALPEFSCAIAYR